MAFVFAAACGEGPDGAHACGREGSTFLSVDHDWSARRPTAEAALDYFLTTPGMPTDGLPSDGYPEVDFMPGLDGERTPVSTTASGQQPERDPAKTVYVHRIGSRFDTTLVAEGFDGTWAISTVVRCAE